MKLALPLAVVLAGIPFAGCNRPSTPVDPRGDAAGAVAAAGVAPWEPLANAACEAGWGQRVVGRSADIVEQPGAALGQKTYCPVSGVVFEVTAASPSRVVAGKPVYVCCPGCAEWFDAHRDEVVRARGWSGSGT